MTTVEGRFVAACAFFFATAEEKGVETAKWAMGAVTAGTSVGEAEEVGAAGGTAAGVLQAGGE